MLIFSEMARLQIQIRRTRSKGEGGGIAGQPPRVGSELVPRVGLIPSSAP